MAEAAVGHKGMDRRVVELVAADEEDFKSTIEDEWTKHPDDGVWFGPVTKKER